MKAWLRSFVGIVRRSEPPEVERWHEERERLNGSANVLRGKLDKDPCADLPAGWECPPSWEDMMEIDRADRERHG